MTKMLQVPEVSRKVTVLAVIVCLTWSTFTFQNVQALGQFVNPVCITSCDGRTDGQYLSCSRCDYYIMCSSGYLSAMPCPATTTYDGYLGVCVSRTIQGCSPTGQRLSPLEPGQSLQPTAGSPSLNEYPNQPYPGPTGSGQYPPTGPTYPIYRPPYYFPSTSKYFDPRFYYPISYPPYYNPSTQPINPPTYPPTNPLTYPPINPPTYPTYPPSNPPTYPPSNPPTYPPSNPPTYPPSNPPTYPPSNPPTYPPTNPPTYPPSNPPTYVPSNPPTYPTYPPSSPPTLYPSNPPTDPSTNPPTSGSVPTTNPIASPTNPDYYNPISVNPNSGSQPTTQVINGNIETIGTDIDLSEFGFAYNQLTPTSAPATRTCPNCQDTCQPGTQVIVLCGDCCYFDCEKNHRVCP